MTTVKKIKKGEKNGTIGGSIGESPLLRLLFVPFSSRVGDETVTIHLKIAARRDERKVVAKFFEDINNRNLSLPDDPNSRPLRFKSDI